MITEFHMTWLSQLHEGAEDLGQRLELSWWEITELPGRGRGVGGVCGGGGKKIQWGLNHHTGLWEALDSAGSEGLGMPIHQERGIHHSPWNLGVKKVPILLDHKQYNGVRFGLRLGFDAK